MKNNTAIDTILDAISDRNPRAITQLISSGEYNEVILREKDTIIKKLDNIMQRLQGLPDQQMKEFGSEILNMVLIQEDFFKFYKEQESKQSKTVSTASVQAPNPPLENISKPATFSLPKTPPKQDELSHQNSPQEEILRTAIRNKNLDQVKYVLNNPDYQNFLIDKKPQIFQTISYAKMDLWQDESLNRDQKMQYNNDFVNIQNSISSKTQEIEKAIEEANRKPSFGERVANFFSEIVQTIKSVLSAKPKEAALNIQPNSVEVQHKVETPNLQQNKPINKQILNDATKLVSNILAKADDVKSLPNSASVNTSKSAAKNNEQAK